MPGSRPVSSPVAAGRLVPGLTATGLTATGPGPDRIFILDVAISVSEKLNNRVKLAANLVRYQESGMEALRSRYAHWQPIVKLNASPCLAALLSLLFACTGCNLCPTAWERERVHNPFPQLKRVAVLPFFNQSDEPTLDTERVAEAYYAALQSIPGFEVLPVGATKAQWLQYSQVHGEPVTGAQFQELARFMGVEALIVGSVTDFDSYYPPRMAMTVHWYAANEGFHPIPPGYGLPWGTEHEKQIPERITREAEFELARSQLATQTPIADPLARTDGRRDVAQASRVVSLNPPTGQSASDVTRRGFPRR